MTLPELPEYTSVILRQSNGHGEIEETLYVKWNGHWRCVDDAHAAALPESEFLDAGWPWVQVVSPFLPRRMTVHEAGFLMKQAAVRQAQDFLETAPSVLLEEGQTVEVLDQDGIRVTFVPPFVASTTGRYWVVGDQMVRIPSW